MSDSVENGDEGEAAGPWVRFGGGGLFGMRSVHKASRRSTLTIKY